MKIPFKLKLVFVFFFILAFEEGLITVIKKQVFAQTTNLVSYWTFDEGQGNQALDSSGSNNTAALLNTPVWTMGKFNGGLQFDGVNDYLRSNISILNPANIDFTVTAWFKLDKINVDQTIISQENGTGTGRVWLWITKNNKLGSFLSGSNSVGTTTLTTNIWYHASLVKTGSNLIFYLNGNHDGNENKIIESATGVNRIGTDKWGSSLFNGTLDEIRIYNRALTQTEIQQIFIGNLVPTPTFTESLTPTSTSTSTITPPATSTPTSTQSLTPTSTSTSTITPPANSTSTSTSTPISSPTPTTVPPSAQTPIANWQFNEGVGNITQDSSNNLIANLVNGTSWIIGKVSNALSFDGNNDYLDTPLSQAPAAVTFTSWIKPDSLGSNLGRIIQKQAEFELILDNTTNQIIFGRRYSTSWGYWKSSSGILIDGSWSHVALTFDSSSAANNPLLYIDGSNVTLSRTLTPSGTSLQNLSHIIIGGIPNAINKSFYGGIDEVKIFNKALSAIEVQNEYASYNVIDTVPPTVTISSLASGTTVSHQIVIYADAIDNAGIGGPTNNSGVQFKIDGINWGILDNVAPFSVQVDTNLLSNGNHTIEAVATDINGLMTTSNPVDISVDNLNSRPNIIVILTDDQRADLMQFMPLTSNIFNTNAVKFTNATVSDPLCCPSRATLLTGLYAHNHGVIQNWPPNGGATFFKDKSTIATWLQSAGYTTAYIGRYFNDYDALGTYIPPGWSDWIVQSSDNGAYYNYDMNENGVIVHYGSTAQEYSTDVFTRKSISFIQNTSTQPFFLIYAPYAPHEPTTPASQDIGTFVNHPNWRPPSYNEADVSDKPIWVRNLPLMNSTVQANTDAVYKRQLETLQSVDRGVRDLFDTLSTTGKLNNTLVIYTSDNGLSMGEHRWSQNKNCVYEECIKVPFWVYKNGLTARDDSALVQNIDLAPSIAELAKVVPISQVNGTSFINRLFAPSASWRGDSLIEYLGHSSDRDFYAVRTDQYLYAEYKNGDKELYDLYSDPYQLDNIVNNPAYAQIVSQLQSSLNSLKTK